MPLHLVIAGPPASGKGTQCELIAERYGIVHISTGDILRAEAKAESAHGRKAKAFMESGALVPDELITAMVIARIAEDDVRERGYLLDGFPRTLTQAQSLSEATTVDAFLLLTTPDAVLVGRAGACVVLLPFTFPIARVCTFSLLTYECPCVLYSTLHSWPSPRSRDGSDLPPDVQTAANGRPRARAASCSSR